MRCPPVGGAVPRLAVMTGRSRVARVSKRIAERTSKRVLAVRRGKQCHNRPTAWDRSGEADLPVRPALVVAGNHQGRSALRAREVDRSDQPRYEDLVRSVRSAIRSSRK